MGPIKSATPLFEEGHCLSGSTSLLPPSTNEQILFAVLLSRCDGVTIIYLQCANDEKVLASQLSKWFDHHVKVHR